MGRQTQLVIFDWDGTLSDSLERIVTCLQISARELDFPEPSDEAGKDIIGLGLPEALAQLFPGSKRDELELFRQCYSKNYVQLDQKPPVFYPQVEETLCRLKDLGYMLAVATGKSRKGLNRILEAHGMTGFFDITRCADETASKPSPLMLKEILIDMAVPASKACMVGDTEFDMAMALAADVPRIGVSYGAHSVDRLKKYDLRGCVDDFALINTYL